MPDESNKGAPTPEATPIDTDVSSLFRPPALDGVKPVPPAVLEPDVSGWDSLLDPPGNTPSHPPTPRPGIPSAPPAPPTPGIHAINAPPPTLRLDLGVMAQVQSEPEPPPRAESAQAEPADAPAPPNADAAEADDAEAEAEAEAPEDAEAPAARRAVLPMPRSARRQVSEEAPTMMRAPKPEELVAMNAGARSDGAPMPAPREDTRQVLDSLMEELQHENPTTVLSGAGVDLSASDIEAAAAAANARVVAPQRRVNQTELAGISGEIRGAPAPALGSAPLARPKDLQDYLRDYRNLGIAFVAGIAAVFLIWVAWPRGAEERPIDTDPTLAAASQTPSSADGIATPKPEPAPSLALAEVEPPKTDEGPAEEPVLEDEAGLVLEEEAEAEAEAVLEEEAAPAKATKKHKKKSTKKSKAPAKATKKKAPAKPKTASQLLSEAKKKLSQGKASEAHTLAAQAFKKGAGTPAAEVMVKASCRLGRTSTAKSELKKLPLLKRGKTKSYCKSRGVKL